MLHLQQLFYILWDIINLISSLAKLHIDITKSINDYILCLILYERIVAE